MNVPVSHCTQGTLDAVIFLAEDDTFGHDLADRRGRRVQTLGDRACSKILPVRIPMKVSPSPMGRQPILLSRILRAASVSVVLGVVHSTRRLINSRTIMAGLLLHGGPTEPNRCTLRRRPVALCQNLVTTAITF
jgi:hypothetical protein